MSALTPPARILVVDDEETIRAFSKRALEQAGYEVSVAPDGSTALQLVEHSAFDLFVLDEMMPEMRGDELARRLRAQNPDVKVLYFTGYSDSLFTEKGTLWANEAFVDKPVNLNGLLEAVSLLLFGHTRGPLAK